MLLICWESKSIHFFSFFQVLLDERGVSRLLFPLSQGPMIAQVTFTCTLEQTFDNTDSISRKCVYSRALVHKNEVDEVASEASP